ncbi:MAG: hypothetical protein ABEJ05_05425 [Haloglomus sp.]
MSDSLLVYDGGNGLFRSGARQLSRLSDGLLLVPWRAEDTRRFLEAQFGDHLFAFVLIDPDAGLVHAGGETVRRLLWERGAPRAVAVAAERTYSAVGDPFGRAVHGREPADIDGTFDIVDSARPHLDSLKRECSLATCTDGRRTGG